MRMCTTPTIDDGTDPPLAVIAEAVVRGGHHPPIQPRERQLCFHLLILETRPNFQDKPLKFKFEMMQPIRLNRKFLIMFTF